MDWAPLGRDYSQELQKQTRAIEARLRLERNKRAFEIGVPGPANIVLLIVLIVTGYYTLAFLSLVCLWMFRDSLEW